MDEIEIANDADPVDVTWLVAKTPWTATQGSPTTAKVSANTSG